ncbi:phosphotransferase [Spiroplasma cantharicola]|uniref:Aminoglycoside phosphotransferase domain-containing protein n=1 Tax=Spiroplasma cantharicola TaxID=362837 RepID=A0A0M3SJ75_9MOLU|nr:phosphotransferase [Spiroplasma cantharicola]ALD66244.1 hypothetical protein SCANT_v1c03340 [Spiroplasma cantharicola]
MKKNGLSGKAIIKKGKQLYKENNNNSNFKKIIEILYLNDFSFFPNYSDIEEKYYKYDFLEGVTLETVQTMPLKSTLKILDIILEYQSFYKTNENKVIVHGDISPVNIIFDDNLIPIKVIDWDGCYFGSKYEDIGYICLLWVNFGDDKQEHAKYIDEIKIIFKYLKYNLQDIIEVKNIILNRIEKDKRYLKDNPRKREIEYWSNYVKKWIQIYWKGIEDEFS